MRYSEKLRARHTTEEKRTTQLISYKSLQQYKLNGLSNMHYIGNYIAHI